MAKLELLKSKVDELYLSNHPNQDKWVTWLHSCHLPFVARKAREIAQRVGADPDLAETAAWLHDIADTVMPRHSEGHEAESLRIARRVMQESGYSDKEIADLVDDALPLHGCHDGKRSATLEGKVMATADALAHLSTDFYVYAVYELSASSSLDDLKAWVLKKAERDFSSKICFDDVREEARPDYEVIKNLFSRQAK